MRRAVNSYLDFVEAHPRSYVAVLRGGVGMDGEVHELIEGAREQFCELVVAGLEIRKPEPRFLVAIWGWMGFVEAACTRWLDERELSRDQLHELLVATTLTTFSQAASG